MFEKVDALDIIDKDIFIPLGPSRTGKGTLLTAMEGYEMQVFERKNTMNTAAGQESAMGMYMAPVDPNNKYMPDTNLKVSHQHNSHTFYPKVVGSPSELYAPYNKLCMVDFPGMFDSKGVVLDIALELSL